MKSLLISMNALLAFCLELAMLAAFGYWGYQFVTQPILRWVMALGIPAMVMVAWGVWGAPKSSRRLTGLSLLVFELGLLLLSSLLLWFSDQPLLAVILAVLAIISQVIAFSTGQ